MSSKRVALLLAALFCLFAVDSIGSVCAEREYGTVAGTVTDPSGGAVVGASVTLTDTSTNISRSETPTILEDTSLRTSSQYLQPIYQQDRIPRFQAQRSSRDGWLDSNPEHHNGVGSVAETVEVTVTAGAELQTLNATVGNTVEWRYSARACLPLAAIRQVS